MHSYAFACYKISSNCSHTVANTVAVTALFITDAQCVPGRRSFDRYYLETLLEKVVRRTVRAHRPRNIVAGDGEESDEDLDGT